MVDSENLKVKSKRFDKNDKFKNLTCQKSCTDENMVDTMLTRKGVNFKSSKTAKDGYANNDLSVKNYIQEENISSLVVDASKSSEPQNLNNSSSHHESKERPISSVKDESNQINSSLNDLHIFKESERAKLDRGKKPVNGSKKKFVEPSEQSFFYNTKVYRRSYTGFGSHHQFRYVTNDKNMDPNKRTLGKLHHLRGNSSCNEYDDISMNKHFSTDRHSESVQSHSASNKRMNTGKRNFTGSSIDNRTKQSQQGLNASHEKNSKDPLGLFWPHLKENKKSHRNNKDSQFSSKLKENLTHVDAKPLNIEKSVNSEKAELLSSSSCNLEGRNVSMNNSSLKYSNDSTDKILNTSTDKTVSDAVINLVPGSHDVRKCIDELVPDCSTDPKKNGNSCSDVITGNPSDTVIRSVSHSKQTELNDDHSKECCDIKTDKNTSDYGSKIVSKSSTIKNMKDSVDANKDHKNAFKKKHMNFPDQRNSPSQSKRKKKRKKKDVSYKTYFINFDLEDSFDEQATKMIHQFEMTSRERVEVDALKDDIFKVFSPIIPDVEPVLFGSVVAGTAFKDSDVDIYLKCHSLPKDNIRDFIIQYGSAVIKNGLFRRGINIANARVPIVKAIHNSTGMSVDVSFVIDGAELHFGLFNSLLVKHLCSHDARVRNLIMLVLFWAKCHKFVGKYRMSSFTFILLVLFYLQIREVLPPLYRLIHINETDTKWPTEFNKDITLLYNNSSESLQSLYLGFFSFYSAVRFNEVVISVYAGELVLGALFDTMDLLPRCYSGYERLVKGKHESPLIWKEMAMCIQEPFNMSWNTVRMVDANVVEIFKKSCLNVCDAFSNFFLNRVLLVVHSEYQYSEGENSCYSWELPCPPDLDSLKWFKQVIKATHKVFSNILLMDVYYEYQYNESTFCKFHLAKSDSSSDEENPIKLIVSCEYLVATKERNKLVKAYQSIKISEFEKEVKASHLYLDVLKKKETKYGLDASIYIARLEKRNSVVVSVNKCTKYYKMVKKQHKIFVEYLKNENFKHLLSLALELNPMNSIKINKPLEK